MACVTSVDFHVHLNGANHGKFEGKRGLIQGDPLSPLLFVLSMDYLSRLLKKISQNNHFKFHPNCKNLGLCHLMFADDLLLFSKADPATLQLMIGALEEFHTTAGLRANLH